ncbi:hemerythrin domain-containing protein [Gordonia sp. CPCC 205515]|uniref:hemerythrin domain-containing protein n=1 Tax=Gordonia sp. CPCC 205515 TaxID=3140791 RepID=UPI003AF340C0
MTVEPHHIADTRSMGIVHSALRRDLRRSRIVLETPPELTGRRRRALADHLQWMIGFLHNHHSGEDRGLWPLIRSKNPSAAELLDQMEADHQRIAQALEVLQDAATRYRTQDADRCELLAALSTVETELLPHLEREEREMLPIVARTITTAEYRAVEDEYFVKHKGFVELGLEGHWVIDGVSLEDRSVMLSVVPPIPRWILLNGFARRYRRRRDLLWGNGPAADVRSISLSRVEGGS